MSSQENDFLAQTDNKGLPCIEPIHYKTSYHGRPIRSNYNI